MLRGLPIIHGRGTALNPPNRFVPYHVEVDFDHVEGDDEYMAGLAKPATTYFIDNTRTIITTNDSPDVMMEASINPYRGCSHGCVYCFARQGHEYLGWSSGLDFETKITVKLDAAKLLRRELSNPRWQPKTISISGVTDCYQPIERKLELTRQCLQVLAEFRNPVGLITKNHLITRDIDVLSDLAAHRAAVAILSVTTLDPDLARVMEPRTSVPRRRLEAIEKLTRAGIPTGVMVAPIVPGLTDHETPAILKAAADAGAVFAGHVPLRLPLANKDLFAVWLQQHFPDRAQKVLNRIKAMRGGKLNDSSFHTRMTGTGPWAEQMEQMFELAKRRAGLDHPSPALSTASFRRPSGPQMTLWE